MPSPGTAATSPARRFLRMWLLPLAVSLGLLWLLTRGIPWSRIAGALGNASRWPLAAYAGLTLLGLLLRAARFRILLPEPRPRVAPLTLATLVQNCLGDLVPVAPGVARLVCLPPVPPPGGGPGHIRGHFPGLVRARSGHPRAGPPAGRRPACRADLPGLPRQRSDGLGHPGSGAAAGHLGGHRAALRRRHPGRRTGAGDRRRTPGTARSTVARSGRPGGLGRAAAAMDGTVTARVMGGLSGCRWSSGWPSTWPCWR